MNTTASRGSPASTPVPHLAIRPGILYFGTPVVLISTENGDGSFNLAPMSSAWALGYIVVLGLGVGGQTTHNLRSRRDLVLDLPSPGQWQAVERLAPLTGRTPIPAHKVRQVPLRAGQVHRCGACDPNLRSWYGRRDYSSAYLRRTYWAEGQVKNETVANLAALPGHVIDLIDAGLKGRQLVPAGEAFTITRSLPHGHVARRGGDGGQAGVA